VRGGNGKDGGKRMASPFYTRISFNPCGWRGKGFV